MYFRSEYLAPNEILGKININFGFSAFSTSTVTPLTPEITENKEIDADSGSAHLAIKVTSSDNGDELENADAQSV